MAGVGKFRHSHQLRVRVESGETEADVQTVRYMAPHHFIATFNLGLLHHRDSTTLPSMRLGTFLSDTDLLPAGWELVWGILNLLPGLCTAVAT